MERKRREVKNVREHPVRERRRRYLKMMQTALDYVLPLGNEKAMRWGGAVKSEAISVDNRATPADERRTRVRDECPGKDVL